MDIRKSESCRDRRVAVAVLVAGLCAAAALPGTGRAATAVTELFSINGPIQSEQAKAYARELDEIARASKTIAARQRLAYEKGLIFFHGGLLDEALAVFEAIVNEGVAKGQVRLCSLNMLAQSARLRGREDLALDAFAQLIASLEEHGKETDPGDVRAKLLYSAHMSRGEIYEKKHDLNHAIQEYESLQARCENLGSLTGREREKAILADKISQHYFKTRQFEKYISNAQRVVDSFPGYYRRGLIELELGCLKQVQRRRLDLKTAKETHQLPSYLIEHLEARNDGEGVLRLLLKDLADKYRGTYAGLIILYHYTWILDTREERQEAAITLAAVTKMVVPLRDLNPGQTRIMATLREYAKVQLAILLGEDGRYSKAAEVLGTLDNGVPESHLTKLKEAVGNSLSVLKREVSPYEN